MVFFCLHELLQYECKPSSPQVYLHAVDMLHIPAFLAVYSSARIDTHPLLVLLLGRPQKSPVDSLAFVLRNVNIII